jgi:hypothetical protein
MLGYAIYDINRARDEALMRQLSALPHTVGVGRLGSEATSFARPDSRGRLSPHEQKQIPNLVRNDKDRFVAE